MIDSMFDINFSLRMQLKAARRQLDAFRSGDMYVRITDTYEKRLSLREKLIRKLRKELEEAHLQTIHVRNIWLETLEEMEKEYKQLIQQLLKENKKESERAWQAEGERDQEKEKAKEWRQKYYETAAALEEEKEKNLKLIAQMNRDYENSSIPSSRSEKHKKITNNREKTGRKPGAQKGHPGHGRSRQKPTQKIQLPPPEKVLKDPAFKKTKKKIVKQLVGIRVTLEVTEYSADVYYNSETGERIHASFPEGVVNDVNYDGSVKAFLYLLNNDCCTSIDKSRQFLSDLTEGKLNISKGMISSLLREFSEKTEAERKKAYEDMLLSPVMHTDCTNARVNGENAYVFICVTPDGQALYYAREKKGHEGVKGTVTEDYLGTLVHDHETTFYKYASNHQECLAHVLRYLKDSIDNEPDRQWNQKMHPLIKEMIHYRNSLPDGEEADPGKVKEFEKRYDEILQLAKTEYEDVPPGDYYREGYNLARRMQKYKENHLLFLHDRLVPATNNEAERCLRKYKRKQLQAVSFRSQESIGYLCDGMSVLMELRRNGEENLFQKVAEIFG